LERDERRIKGVKYGADSESRHGEHHGQDVVRVTFVEDRRGRVPFALVAVLLLVGSLVYAQAIAVRGPVRETHAADTALDRAEATARTAIRTAGQRAARKAARNPVVVPANTTAGVAVNESTAFRDALALRAAFAVSDALARTSTAVGTVRVESSLPPLENSPSAAAALRRVHVEPVADGTAFELTVHNVTHVARTLGSGRRSDDGDRDRDGDGDGETDGNGDERALAQRNTTVTVTIHLPVFTLRDRTASYERQLNRGPVAGIGLGRQLTGQLTALTEARGLAQYGGVGIENVLGNRHVELAANGGMLRLQRETFGRADPAGRESLLRASAKVGLTDVLAAKRSGTKPGTWTRSVLDGGQRAVDGISTLGPEPEHGRRTTQVGVNHTADEAYLRVVDEDLDGIVRGAYRATVIRRVRVTDRDRGEKPPPESPGENWSLVRTTRERRSEIVERGSADTTRRRVFGVRTRVVRVTHTVRRVWTNTTALVASGGGQSDGTGQSNRTVTKTTRAVWTDTYTVRLVRRGRYTPTLLGATQTPPGTDQTALGPTRPTRPVFSAGGPLDGPNLGDIAGRDVLTLSREDADELAQTAVTEGDVTERRTVVGSRPPKLREWIRRDLLALREQVRNVSVRVTHGGVASGESNAAGRLAATLRERRSELLDAPRTYYGVAGRARVAARAAYLDRVIALLDARADTEASYGSELQRVLRDAAPFDGADVHAASAAAARATAPEPSPVGGSPLGPLTLVPDTNPSYLTLTPVSGRRIASLPAGETVRPLAARNVNVFTVPYDDVGDVASGWLSPESESKQVTLGTAGRALVTTNATLANERVRRAVKAESASVQTQNSSESPPPSLAKLQVRRDRLHHEVAPAVVRVERRLRPVLTDALESIDRGDATGILDAASARYAGDGALAVALTNGSYADAVALAATRRLRLSPAEQEQLTIRLRVELRRITTNEDVTVPGSAVSDTVSLRRRIADHALKKATTKAAEKRLNRVRKRIAGEAFDTVLAGFPVAPVPGYWYATVNVWYVQVRGEYPRFAVTARRGNSKRPGSSENGAMLRYVRTDSAVTLDVDGDGTGETIGYNRAVSFRTRAVALAVVPAGKGGVGDVDGNADERSGGWACPDGPACSRNRFRLDTTTTAQARAPLSRPPEPATTHQSSRRAAPARSARATWARCRADCHPPEPPSHRRHPPL
jgi:hypothetical protein